MRQFTVRHIEKMIAASKAASCEDEAAVVSCGPLKVLTEHERGEGYRVHFAWKERWEMTGWHARVDLAAMKVRRSLPETI